MCPKETASCPALRGLRVTVRVPVSCVCVLCLWPCELFLRLTVPVRVCLIASRVAIHDGQLTNINLHRFQ